MYKQNTESYNQSTPNLNNQNAYQFPENNTDVTNHINSIHNNRMMDRQFNLPNIPFDPQSFNNINNLPPDTSTNIMNNQQQQYIPNQPQATQNYQQQQYIPNLPQDTPQYQERHIFTDNHNSESILQNSLKVFQLESNYTENQLKDSYRV